MEQNSRELNEKAFCFIICNNSTMWMEECMRYISRLYVPEGYQVEVLGIEQAKCMTAGYNEGMTSTNAKYKIYMHQDVFILNRYFLYDIVTIFESDEKIGLIGMVGNVELSADGMMWHNPRFGALYGSYQAEQPYEEYRYSLEDGLLDCVALDGLMLVTQYDVVWREDLFQGWDFYDVSQSLEFLKAGYRVVVPTQTNPWVLHDDGMLNLWNYDYWRKIFIKEYRDFFPKQQLQRKEYPPKNGKKRGIYPKKAVESVNDIPWTLIEMGYDMIIPEIEIPLDSYDGFLLEMLVEQMEMMEADFAISHDFSPNLSAACKKLGIPYISWAFDAPLQTMYREEANYETNHFFCFDRQMMKQFENRAFSHFEYLPLAANVERMSGMLIEKKDEEKYSYKISLVGSLYEDNVYQKFHKRISEEAKADIETWIETVKGHWNGENSIHQYLSEKTIQNLVQVTATDVSTNTKMDNRFFFETLLARELTYRERKDVLNRIAEKYPVVLHTTSNVNGLVGVDCKGYLDYAKELPKAYHLSKINLNITLRSIESGVPQRIFDIMAAGGFVLTSAQPEIEELFEIGKDLVVFHDYEEMMEQIDYYLSHEKERLTIAMHGYQTVCEKYTYKKAITSIMEKVFE